MTFDDLKFYELFQKFRFRNELLMNYMNFPGLCVLYSSLKFFFKKNQKYARSFAQSDCR